MKISSSLKIQLVIKSLNLDTKYEKDEFRNFIKHTLCHRTLVYKQVEGRGRICHQGMSLLKERVLENLMSYKAALFKLVDECKLVYRYENIWLINRYARET